MKIFAGQARSPNPTPHPGASILKKKKMALWAENKALSSRCTPKVRGFLLIKYDHLQAVVYISQHVPDHVLHPAAKL